MLKKKVDGQAHWLPSKGTPQEAAQYCKKDGNWWEVGECPVAGKRTDLDAVALKVRNGASLQEIAEEHPAMFVVYSRGFAALQSKLMKDRTEKPHVSWVWGSTGVGKTKYAVELCKSFYMKDGTKWWDGYEQQECIILDDYEWDEKRESFRYLLRLLDRYKFQGETKGSYVKINSREIVITCEHPPSHFWGGGMLAQILRRCDQVITFAQR